MTVSSDISKISSVQLREHKKIAKIKVSGAVGEAFELLGTNQELGAGLSLISEELGNTKKYVYKRESTLPKSKYECSLEKYLRVLEQEKRVYYNQEAIKAIRGIEKDLLIFAKEFPEYRNIIEKKFTLKFPIYDPNECSDPLYKGYMKHYCAIKRKGKIYYDIYAKTYILQLWNELVEQARPEDRVPHRIKDSEFGPPKEESCTLF